MTNIYAIVVVGVSTEMTLCECEKAGGAPNGLSCDKEGWFISSFEREGSWVRFDYTSASSTAKTLIPSSMQHACIKALLVQRNPHAFLGGAFFPWYS